MLNYILDRGAKMLRLCGHGKDNNWSVRFSDRLFVDCPCCILWRGVFVGIVAVLLAYGGFKLSHTAWNMYAGGSDAVTLDVAAGHAVDTSDTSRRFAVLEANVHDLSVIVADHGSAIGTLRRGHDQLRGSIADIKYVADKTEWRTEVVEAALADHLKPRARLKPKVKAKPAPPASPQLTK